MRIRNLRFGVFYRPIDTPAGKQGWCGDIYWEVFKPKRNCKNSNHDNRHVIAINWEKKELHFGPNINKKKMLMEYEPKLAKLKEIEKNPTSEK